MSFSGRRVRFLLGLTVTASFLWLLLRQLNFSEITAAISRLSLLSCSIALFFLSIGYLLRAVRWWWIVRALAPQVPLSACLGPFLIGNAVNNLLPFRVGDALRAIGFREQLRSPAMRLVGTLVIERLLDLITLLGFFFIGLMGVTTGRVPASFVQLAIWITLLGVVFILIILLFSSQLERLFHRVADHSWFAKRQWSEPIKRHISHLFDALGVLRMPMLKPQLIVLSITAWGLEGAVFATVAQALDLKMATAGPWFALATGTLATLLPSSPGYIGTFDYFAMLGLVAYGAERDTATLCALVVHAMLWLAHTVAGMVVYLFQPNSRLLLKQAEAISTQKESI